MVIVGGGIYVGSVMMTWILTGGRAHVEMEESGVPESTDAREGRGDSNSDVEEKGCLFRFGKSAECRRRERRVKN